MLIWGGDELEGMSEWVKGGKAKRDEELGFEDWGYTSRGRSGMFLAAC